MFTSPMSLTITANLIPFLFESYDHAHRALDGEAGALLASKADGQGMKILSNWEWGFRQVTNNKMPIEKPEDFKQLKMRVPNEIQLEAMYKTLGSTTSIIAFPELYMALAQGVVDGQCNPLSTIYYDKFYEVQKYLTILNHVYNTQMLVMSEKCWNSLTPEQQEIVERASLEAGEVARAENLKSEENIIAEMERLGLKLAILILDLSVILWDLQLKPLQNLQERNSQKNSSSSLMLLDKQFSRKGTIFVGWSPDSQEFLWI